MRFGSTYKLDDIRKKDLTGFASALGVKPKTVETRVEQIIESSSAAWEQVSALPELKSSNAIVEALRSGWETRSKDLIGE